MILFAIMGIPVMVITILKDRKDYFDYYENK
jgi:hypothetical protein